MSPWTEPKDRVKEPLARGVVVPLGGTAELKALAKETLSILRALGAEGQEASAPPATAESIDFVALLVHRSEPDEPLRAPTPPALALPDLKDRAATAIGIGDDAAVCRATVSALRKQLRAAGATLGPHELVLSTKDFGYLGLESDGLREKLEILLSAIATDAERLRLKREGWEEPAE